MNLIRYNPQKDNELNEKIIYFLFDSQTCRVCTELKGRLELMDIDLDIYLIDADEHSDEARRNNLVGLPCVIRKIDGKEDERFYGNRDEVRIINFINEE